jgi:transcriptional regulator with XRE-family HTH domain
MLREMRGEHEISQAELSRRSGVPLTTIQKIEQGYSEPTFSTFIKLARALRADLGDFTDVVVE